MGGPGGVNTGGGQGGSNDYSGASAPAQNGGGSGIVIIRYSPGTQQSTGGTVTTSPGYTIHTFTGPGTFTTNANFISTAASAAQYSVN
jgi:hypothetical protein